MGVPFCAFFSYLFSNKRLTHTPEVSELLFRSKTYTIEAEIAWETCNPGIQGGDGNVDCRDGQNMVELVHREAGKKRKLSEFVG